MDEAAMTNAQGRALAAVQAGPNGYLFLAGSAFHPRTSSQTLTYEGSGCISSDDAVTTDLQLPEGAVINGIRIYYYNMGQPGNVTTFLTVYDGAGTYTDLLVSDSTQDLGYASEYEALPSPETVDNLSQAYVLTANTDTGTQFCGVRVFYAAPCT